MATTSSQGTPPALTSQLSGASSATIPSQGAGYVPETIEMTRYTFTRTMSKRLKQAAAEGDKENAAD